MPKQGPRRVGVPVAERCLAALDALRRKTAEDVAMQRDGEWRGLPADLSMAAFAEAAFPGTSASTIRNWTKQLADAGLFAHVGPPAGGQYVVRMDGRLTAAQLIARLNATDDATPSADQPPVRPAPAGTALESSGGVASTEPALTGSVEYPLVSAGRVDAMLARTRQLAQLLEELMYRRAAESELRRLLEDARVLALQQEQRIAQMLVELQAARAVPALPAEVVQMALQVDDLLEKLGADATE